jgi:toxin YoeB
VKVHVTTDGWADHRHWQEADRGILDRLHALIEDTGRSPFKGLGKPEPLKGPLAGWWSRRITGDHRLVYRVAGQGAELRIEIAACRHHY